MPVFSCLKPLNLSSLVKSCIHSTFLKCFQNKQLCCGSVRIPNFLLFESHGDVLRCFSLTLKYLERFLISSVGSIFIGLFAEGLEKLLGVGKHESRMMAIPGWPLAPWDSVTIRCNAEQPVLGTKAEEREHMTFFYNLLPCKRILKNLWGNI